MAQESVFVDFSGIRIRVRAPEIVGLPLAGRSYSPFISRPRKKNDLNVNIRFSPPPNYNITKKIFDTEDSWSLCSLGSGRHLYKEEVINREHPYLARWAIIRDRPRSVTVYLNEKRAKSLGLLDVLLDMPLGQFLLQNELSTHNGILIHGCGVSYKGKGFVFMGSSGSGKTTLANIWKEAEAATVLNDERLIVRKIGNQFFVCGTPWTGNGMICSNSRVTLKRIYFIKHARANYVRHVKPQDLLQAFLTNIRLPLWDKKRTEKVLALAGEILKEIPVFELGFMPDKRIIDHVIG